MTWHLGIGLHCCGAFTDMVLETCRFSQGDRRISIDTGLPPGWLSLTAWWLPAVMARCTSTTWRETRVGVVGRKSRWGGVTLAPTSSQSS